MRKMIRALLRVLVCLALIGSTALAEDCFVIDVDALDLSRLNSNDYVAEHLTAPAEGVRVRKYISDSNELAAQVRLTITQAETGTLVFDKYYGYVSGTFDSGAVYLPYVDNNTIPYLITLNVESWTYAMPFMRRQPRLEYNSACTYGVRLRDYDPALTGNWVMGTMLDLDELRRTGGATIPLCASNLYTAGRAMVSVAGDALTVRLEWNADANVEVHAVSVFLTGDVSALTTDNPAAIGLPAWAVGQSIDIAGLSTALLYVPVSLSYDPAGLSRFAYDLGSADLSRQLALWNRALSGNGANAPAVTQAAPETPFPEETATVPPEETAVPPEEPAAAEPAADGEQQSQQALETEDATADPSGEANGAAQP